MIKLYTDGACSGNPGVGGWSYIAVSKDVELFSGQGNNPNTTNNRMELTAAIEGLVRIILEDSVVEVYSDSLYLVNTMKGLYKKSKNVDLWKTLNSLVSYYDHIDWYWVKAHDTNQWNNEADLRARGAIKSVQSRG